MIKLALVCLSLAACSRSEPPKSAAPQPGAAAPAADDREARKAGLKRYSLHMCDAFPALAPPGCKAHVEQTFEGCVDPMLIDRRKSSAAFAACLGFRMPSN
jgi:hypothetical protein